MDDRGLQGWARDPFQLHESRYFSAGRPTKLVRDGDVESYDEPPSGTHEPADATPATLTAAKSPTADGLERTTAAAPPSHTAAALAQIGTAPRYAGAKGWYTPGPVVPPEPYIPPGPHVTPALYTGQAPPRSDAAGRRGPDPDPAPVQPRRRAGLFAAAALIVAVAVFAAVKLVNGSGSTTNPNQATTSPVAFVTHSAEQTLARHTVDLTVSGTLPVSGKTVTVGGTGAFNFDTNAMALDMRMAGPGGVVNEKELLVNRHSFFAISINGASFTKLAGGRHWIQTPVQQSATANLAGRDPLSSLSVLEQQGSTVQPLGSKTIDGVSCIGYAVTPSLQAMLTATREEDAKLGVSAVSALQDLQQTRSMTPPTITIWSDAHGLAQEISINLPINVQGSPSSGAMVMDFSHFGAPVSITAPAPSDTISYSSFMKDFNHNAA